MAGTGTRHEVHSRHTCRCGLPAPAGRIKDLIVNIPPGFAKSMISAVFMPAWVWIRKPEYRFLFASYKAEYAIRDSVKCRTLIQSRWYQERWGNRFQLKTDQNEKSKFENDRTGY